MKIKMWFKNLQQKTKRLANIIKIMLIEFLIIFALLNGFFIWLLNHYKLLDDLILKLIGR